MTALLEVFNLSTALLKSFDLFFVNFSGGKEHLPLKLHPIFGL